MEKINKMIKDVVITSLRKIPDERGSILHMLRSDAKHFIQFGEIYFSTAYPGVVKVGTNIKNKFKIMLLYME